MSGFGEAESAHFEMYEGFW